MRKTWKKLLAMILVVLMVVSMVPTTAMEAYAAEDEVTTEATEEVTTEATETVETTEAEEEPTEATEATTEEKTTEATKTVRAKAETQALAETQADMSTITKNQSVALDTSKTYKVFHLDNGRKYFTVDQIKAIIDTMSANDYNYLELAIGNDGLRFLLDDMSVTVNGTTYSSANVTAGIKAGNKAYCDCGTNELTQSEMDEIIAYAKAKSISIIPLVNTPGHMDAILTAMKQVGISNPNYSTSVRTVDITNGTAADFTLALVNKYIQYFAGKGCEIFNMGADEYANDIQSQPQFAGLISSGKYKYFVQYVNNMAAQIQNAGMVPMAFNDGIYYNQNTSGGTFDSNIVISYWSSGWSGYNVASASYLYNKGHKILNTNGNWYYVLNAANGTSWSTAKSRLQSTPYDSVQGSSVPVVGAMVCYWCDTPSYSYSSTEQQNVQDMITTFAAANPTVFDLNKETTEPETPVDPDPENPGTETPDVDKSETINLKVGESTTKNIVGANYAGTYTPEPEGIASVTVTGKGKVEASTTTNYSSTSVRRSTLTNGNTSWTKTSYFYKVGDKYYPVYAYQSYFWGGHYYYGYSTTDSASNVTEISNSTSGTGSWTVYEFKSTTVPGTDASTTITFLGEKVGTTYVTIGDTKYTVNVIKNTQTVRLYVDNSETYTDTAANTAKSANTSIATATANGSNVTIKGVKVGSTTVETDTTIYNVTVVPEDLSSVTNATIELWITNQRITANNKNTVSVKATDAYSENGIAVKDIVPATGKSSNSDNNVLWKVTALDKTSHEQTTSAGDNESLNGTDFNYIRYYNKTWSYSADGKTWTDITSNTQLVAYYLQRTTVTDEITTDVVDYGVVPHIGYNSSNFVILDYSVKYESGEEVPSSFPVSGKTMGFHCDPSDKNTVHQYNGGSSSTWSNNYRDIAMIRGVETADYEVYMITVTPTSNSQTEAVASNCYIATSYNYAGTEYVAWAATQTDIDNSGLSQYSSISGKYTCTVGGDPVVSGLEIFNRHGMKVTYYVRAKVTEDSLTVNYVNETTGENFYNYNIAVQSGTVFNTGIALANPWKANLKNGSVTNLLGKTQTVSADLSTMPAIGVSYRYSEYTCTKVEKSSDGKTVTLYYTFNNEHKFVVDFGLPLKITTEELGISGDWTSTSVYGAQYGTANAVIGEGVTYTPDKILKGVEQLSLVLSNGNETSTQIIYIYPATTVYYEEGFANYTGIWESAGSKGTQLQTTNKLGESKDAYGFDKKYADEDTSCSNNSETKTNVKNAIGKLEFTGTGIDIYANCQKESGNVVVQVKDAAGKNVKSAIVQCSTNTTIDEYVTTVRENNLPIVSLTGLAYGSYDVTLTTVTSKEIAIDGYRVYGTIDESKYDPSPYVKDDEDKPSYVELRDKVLVAAGIKDSEDITSQVNPVLNGEAGAVIVTDQNTLTKEQANQLLENGPKNELFLAPGSSVVFKADTNKTVQVGMKAVNKPVYVEGSYNGQITSSTDMFYKVKEKNALNQTITITNESGGLLSITKIKVCDDPNFTMAALTEKDLDTALYNLDLKEVPQLDTKITINFKDKNGKLIDSFSESGKVPEGEKLQISREEMIEEVASHIPEGYKLVESSVKNVKFNAGDDYVVDLTVEEVKAPVETADATLTIKFVNYAGKNLKSITLKKNGEKNKKAKFTATEIIEAAKNEVPAGYELYSTSKVKAVEVKYGSKGTASVKAGKAATLKVTYKKGTKKVKTVVFTAPQTSKKSSFTFSKTKVKNGTPKGYKATNAKSVKVKFGKTVSKTVKVK